MLISLPANIKSTLTWLRDDHLALGKGTIRFTELIKRIRTTGYDDTLTLEIFENDRQTLVQSKNLVKSLLNK